MTEYVLPGVDPTTNQFPSAVVDALRAQLGVAAAPSLLLVGDSLTAGMAGANSAVLSSTFGGRVINIGIGGQGARDIAARQGGTPALATVAGNTIPASGTVPVTMDINLLNVNGAPVTLSTKGSLAGVAGTLTMYKDSSSVITHTFTRAVAGSAIAVGTSIPFLSPVEYTGMVQVVGAGRNGFTVVPTADLIGYVRSMLAVSGLPASQHLVLGIPPDVTETPGTNARTLLDASNAALRQTFPRNWVDVPGYLRSEVTLRSVGITPTAQDLTDISNSVTPVSFRSTNDGLHYNAKAYEAITPLLIRELAARGVVGQSATAPVDPGTSNPAPTTVHGNGVAGATHRYVPEASELAVGSSVTSIRDLIGSADLIPVGAANAVSPVIAATGGQKYVEMVTGSANKALETSSADLGSTFTFATVVRASGGGGTGMSVTADGYTLRRAGDNSWQMDGSTGSGAANASLNGPQLTSDFVVLFGIGANANSRLGVNASITTGAGSITGPISSTDNVIRWGYPSTTTPTAGNHDYVEMNVWPFALDATQRAAHVAAMKSKWTALLTT